jgi:hypothetical protein
LEELVFDESPSDSDITAMDNSLESMIDTYSDIKELINTAMDNFRRSNLTVICSGNTSGQLQRMIQISITGIDVWRRAVISHDCTMEDLHKLIQVGMSWSNNSRFRFYCERSDGSKEYLHDKIKLDDIDFPCKNELIYEYGKWSVKVIIMSSYQGANNTDQGSETCRFLAGEGNAPPEQIEGVRHFKRLVGSLENGGITERNTAQRELGIAFETGIFDLGKINRNLRDAFSKEEK